jgi:ACS family allantoate permease-like MFS transporter
MSCRCSHSAVFNLMATIPNGALGTFQVLVFQSFGFTNLQSILYGLPSSAIGCIFIIITAIIVNRVHRLRFPFALLWNIVPMIVFLYVGLADAGKWQKWACFSFVSVFAISTFMLWSIIPLNTAGRTKKSFMSASVFIAYCAGNMVGSQIFLPSDAPKYLHGLTACAIVMAVNTVNISCWWAYYLYTNKKREAAFIASGMSMEERDHLNKLAGETDVTDLQNPHFRYSC